jgi:hypothetical protein
MAVIDHFAICILHFALAFEPLGSAVTNAKCKMQNAR